MITIAGTTYFTFGAGFVVLLLAAPLLWAFSVWALRPNIEGKPLGKRLAAVVGLTTVLVLGLAVGLFWDVYLIGQQAKALCEETGLVVSRKVTARSLAGLFDIEYWSKLGFAYVENANGKQPYRYSLVDDCVRREPIGEFSSAYEYASEREHIEAPHGGVDEGLIRSASALRDRATGEEPGRLTAYTISPGWLDRAVISLSGLSFSPKHCEKQRDGMMRLGNRTLTVVDPVTAVVQPTPNPRMDAHEDRDDSSARAIR